MPGTVLTTTFKNPNAGICQLSVQNSSVDSSQIVWIWSQNAWYVLGFLIQAIKENFRGTESGSGIKGTEHLETGCWWTRWKMRKPTQDGNQFGFMHQLHKKISRFLVRSDCGYKSSGDFSNISFPSRKARKVGKWPADRLSEDPKANEVLKSGWMNIVRDTRAASTRLGGTGRRVSRKSTHNIWSKEVKHLLPFPIWFKLISCFLNVSVFLHYVST